MTGPEPATGALAPVRSPLFARLMGLLEARPRPVVIDLGAASSGVLARMVPMRARLEIVDLPSALATWQPDPEDAEPGRWFVDWLLPPGPRPADAVLAWDLPNYLPLPVLDTLMRALGQRCRRGALVHMLSTYTHSQMPARPGRYVPADGDELRCEPTTDTLVNAPRYTSEALGSALTHMHPERAVLLKSGMQELLFEVE